MNKIYESRQQIVSNYKFYNDILPKGYLKVHFKPLSYYGYNTSLSHIPNYIFKYNNPMPNNQPSVIIRDDNKKPNKSLTKISKNKFKPLNYNLDNQNEQNNIYNRFKTESMINNEATQRIFDSTMLNICQSDYNKNFKTNGVKVFYTKNNLYLPSITERMKNKKPRYDREERKIYRAYETSFN